MGNEAQINLENNRLIVSGDLDFLNVTPIWEKSLLLTKNCSRLHFDFSKVSSSKSAALALLVEWIKLARRENKPLQFDNIPKDLMSVASVCGMDVILFHVS